MKNKRRRKLNNTGSTLITVLVAVSFLVILSSIIITISSANVRMKQVEYAMKQNFYVDEIGLDDIYNGIGRDVSAALSKAYSQTLIGANATGLYPTQKAAYIAFAGLFKNELITLYGDAGTATTETLEKLNGYISRNETGEVLKVESFDGIDIESDPETGADMWRYIFKNVKVKYVKEDTYESVITTDIVIDVPYINFFQNFSQILDYSLIGNEGIYFNSASASVEGNVYAGIDSAEHNAAYAGYMYDTDLYDGINFNKSSVTFTDCGYIISKGDFNICESSVTINSSKPVGATGEAQSNLWVENIRTVENGRSYTGFGSSALTPSKLDAVANIFVADDLELNAGNSSVKLGGNYYGYNYNNSGSAMYTTFENRNLKEKYALGDKMQAANTTSSAIVVNAPYSTLDLSNLNTLIVAGVAYVDIKDGAKAYSGMAAGEAQEFRTGESIAMRYNQFMYLAPTEILTGVSNPQLNGSTDVQEVCPTIDNLKLESWFGRGYLDEDKPIIPVVYQDNGKSYTYYYLNLKDGKVVQYVKDIMEAADPGEEGSAADKQKWALKQEIEVRAKNSDISSHITIGSGSESSVKIYTQGLLTDTQETEKTLQKSTIDTFGMASRSTSLQKHYAQLYVNLEPNLVADVEEENRISKKYPLKNFLDLDELQSGKLPNNMAGKEVDGVKDAKVWIISEGISPVLDLSGNALKGIVLCDGDLTVTGNGGSFEGLIVATGKITVKGNVTVKADRGIVQSVLEAEQRSVLEAKKDKLDEIKLNQYASHYFLNTVLVGLVSLEEDDVIDMDKRVTGTEYTDYIYYNNWRRGEVSASP